MQNLFGSLAISLGHEIELAATKWTEIFKFAALSRLLELNCF